MKYLSLAIVPFMVGILTPLVFGLIRKSNLKKETKMNEKDFVMCFSLAWAWAFFFTSIGLAAILVLLNIFEAANLAANIIVPSFIILFLFGLYAIVREKIIIKENTIIIIPIFGRTKVCTFSEIKKLKEVIWSNGTISYKVFKDKKLFSISSSVPGFNLFMERIRKEKIRIETTEKQMEKRKNKQ